MKIGIDIRSVARQRTGDENYTIRLINSLKKADRKNQYFLYTDTKDKKQLREIREKLGLKGKNSRQFQVVPVLPATKFLWTFFSLPFYLRKNPVDILHVQYICPFWLPRKIKLITTVHDISFARYPKFISWKDLFFLKILIPPSLKRADKIVAVSRFTKKEISQVYGIDKSKIAVVYNIVQAENYQPSSKKELARVRKKFHLEKPSFLYIGTLQPRKNIIFTIQAFVELKKRHADNPKVADYQLVIGGNRKGHNYDGRIDQLMDELKATEPKIYRQIKFTGFIPDEELSTVYQLAEAAVFSSLYEGFGLPMLEAMAHQKPVICSDSSCHKEIVQDAALVYEEGEIADLVEKMVQLIEDKKLRQELVKRGRRRVARYNEADEGKKMLKVYREVA